MSEEFKTYLFSLEVVPLTVGKAYTNLPLHCTLMHRFHTTAALDELTMMARELFSATTPIKLIAGEHLAFGPKQRLATLLDKHPAFVAVHASLFDRLNRLGVKHTESEWVGKGYTPHVSDQHGERLPEVITLSTAAYLIEVEHPLQGTRRFVRHKFALG